MLCCDLLLLHDAEPNIVNNEGLTAIDLAVKFDRKEVADRLRTWQLIGLTHTEKLQQQLRIKHFVNKEAENNSHETEDIFLELQSLKTKQALNGIDHSGNIVTLVKLSKLFAEQNRFEKAIEMMEEELRISGVADDGENKRSVDIAILKCNTAPLYRAVEKREISIQLLLEALEIFNK